MDAWKGRIAVGGAVTILAATVIMLVLFERDPPPPELQAAEADSVVVPADLPTIDIEIRPATRPLPPGTPTATAAWVNPFGGTGGAVPRYAAPRNTASSQGYAAPQGSAAGSAYRSTPPRFGSAGPRSYGSYGSYAGGIPNYNSTPSSYRGSTAGGYYGSANANSGARRPAGSAAAYRPGVVARPSPPPEAYDDPQLQPQILSDLEFRTSALESAVDELLNRVRVRN